MGARQSMTEFAELGDGLYQVTSKSDPNKSYIIDVNDLKAHKSDCIAYRYGKECNHIKALKKGGIING